MKKKQLKKIINLLNCGKKVELSDKHGGTILHHLWQISNEEDLNIVVETFKQEGLLDKTNSLGQTAFMIALIHNNPKLANLLIEETDIKVKDFQNNYVINFAHYCFDENILKSLVQKSSEAKLLNLKDSAGYTPLMRALAKNNSIFANLLLNQKDIDIEILGWGKSTILHYLSGVQDQGVIKAVLEKCDIKKMIDSKNYYNQTPLNLASEACNSQLVKLLIENGADVKNSFKDSSVANYALSKFTSGKVEKLLRSKLEEARIIDKQVFVVKKNFDLKVNEFSKLKNESGNKFFKVEISLSRDESYIIILAGKHTKEIFELLQSPNPLNEEQTNLGGDLDNSDE